MINTAIVCNTLEIHLVGSKLFLTDERSGTQLSLSPAEVWGLLSFLYDWRNELWRLCQEEHEKGEKPRDRDDHI